MIPHTALCGKLDLFMTQAGWHRNSVIGGLPVSPDRVYSRRDEDIPLIMEIKPSNITMRELATGIGQTTIFLPYRAKPYLVIPSEWADFAKAVWQHLPIGVISYDGDFKITQKAPERSSHRLILLHLGRKPFALSRRMVFDYLKKQGIEGDYSLSELIDDLQQAYPEVSVSQTWLSRILKDMGFDKLQEPLKTPEQIGVYFVLRDIDDVLHRYEVHYSETLHSETKLELGGVVLL